MEPLPQPLLLKPMAKKKTFEQLFAELNALVQAIESDELPLDQLSKQVAHAATLIEACKQHLTQAEEAFEALKKKENP